MKSQLARVMFAYWGRRGALPQFTLEVARTALADPGIAASISVSRQVENFSTYRAAGLERALFAIDTFHSGAGALLQAWRIPLLRRRLYQRLRQDRTEAVIELMPHIWSPLVMPVVHAAGARYLTIIHDADAHPGDPTSRIKSLIDRAMTRADLVVTLSSAVADRLLATGRVPEDRLLPLFLPDLGYGPVQPRTPPAPGQPWRLLFFGRIMPYKGLGLFLDSIDQLRREGQAVEAGIFGEGSLAPHADRLARMQGVEVVNHWLTAPEIADAFSRYHAIVLSHTEASQSGVAAAAFGAGLPVVATPVGGLVEQVVTGVTGVLAHGIDAVALAAAIRQLFEPDVYRTICGNLQRSAANRSMARFVSEIVRHAVQRGGAGQDRS